MLQAPCNASNGNNESTVQGTVSYFSAIKLLEQFSSQCLKFWRIATAILLYRWKQPNQRDIYSKFMARFQNAGNLHSCVLTVQNTAQDFYVTQKNVVCTLTGKFTNGGIALCQVHWRSVQMLMHTCKPFMNIPVFSLLAFHMRFSSNKYSINPVG